MGIILYNRGIALVLRKWDSDKVQEELIMESIMLYHGSGEKVEFPEVRKTRYAKDFSWGFYCTKSYEQEYRWAQRRHEEGVINYYSYIEKDRLNIKKFSEMTDEWLDFIADCRLGKIHDYDIVDKSAFTV